MAHDHPTYADSIGRLKLLEEVGQHLQTCRPPQVVGVFGDWGSGKTSFMRALEVYLAGVDVRPETAELDRKPNRTPEEEKEWEGIAAIKSAKGSSLGYPVVWFDAWLYQAEEVPVVALLHEIRRQFSPGSRWRKRISKWGEVVLDAALMSFDPISKAISGVAPGADMVGNVRKAAERYERDRFEVPLTSDQIRVQLNHAIKTILHNISVPKVVRSGGRQRLTIIIDDLDRCEPAMALRLLEGLKVFLNIDQCVFVLGVNRARIVEHVATLYRGKANAETEGPDKFTFAARDYLDKIIGVHYALGVAGNTGNLTAEHMPSVSIKQGSVERDWKDELLKVLKDNPCLPPNPRRIKAYLATLSRYNGRTFKDEPEPVLLVAFAYLNHFHPEIIRKMQFYSEFHTEFFAWLMADQQSGDGSFTGLLPDPTYFQGAVAQGKSKFPDPIYDNLLHVHSLLRDWADGSSPLALMRKGDKSSQELFGDYFLLA